MSSPRLFRILSVPFVHYDLANYDPYLISAHESLRDVLFSAYTKIIVFVVNLMMCVDYRLCFAPIVCLELRLLSSKDRLTYSVLSDRCR